MYGFGRMERDAANLWRFYKPCVDVRDNILAQLFRHRRFNIKVCDGCRNERFECSFATGGIAIGQPHNGRAGSECNSHLEHERCNQLHCIGRLDGFGCHKGL